MGRREGCTHLRVFLAEVTKVAKMAKVTKARTGCINNKVKRRNKVGGGD